MRDRRPPSNPWSRGTRAANISRQRAILMAFNPPFAISASSTSCITAAAARPRPGPFNRFGPGTSDLLPIHHLPQLRVHGRDPSPALALARPTLPFVRCYCCGSASTAGTLQPLRSWHVRPSARLSASSLLSTLVRAVRRDAYVLLCPGGSVPCDVRNSTPSGHGCLLRPLQIFGSGEARAEPSRHREQVGDGLFDAVVQREVG
jgi:hypothetical protein